jgi:hypothetical protein
MLRRTLAIALVLSWIILSGYDVTEDLDLPAQTALQESTESASGTGFAGLLARNIVESAAHEGVRCSSLLEQRTAPRMVEKPQLAQKISRLHKVNRVFII